MIETVTFSLGGEVGGGGGGALIVSLHLMPEILLCIGMLVNYYLNPQKVCRIIASWAVLWGFAPLFDLHLGV